jgi:hypothetical protein
MLSHTVDRTVKSRKQRTSAARPTAAKPLAKRSKSTKSAGTPARRKIAHQKNPERAGGAAKTKASQGGSPFSYGSLAYMLRNRIYIGETGYHGKWYPGEHEAIIDQPSSPKTLVCARDGSPKAALC